MYKKVILDNGVRVVLERMSSLKSVALGVWATVGSRYEGRNEAGFSHFIEHMMFKGTDKFPAGVLDKAIDRLGGSWNAQTFIDYTAYYETLPAEHIDLALEIEADRMRGALIDPDDLESERTVILNELDRGENDPIRNLYHSVWSTAFLAHPYHHPTIGWRSDVETVTPAGLRHFYDTFYWPSNATVSVIGDAIPAEVLPLIDRTFGQIDRGPELIPEVTTREPAQRGERRVTVRQAGQLGALMIAYKAPHGRHPDADALDLLSMVLGYGKTSRLHRALTDPGITTHASASASRLRDPGLFYVFALLAPGSSHEEVEKQIRALIEGVARDGVTEGELERARNQLRAHESFERDGPFAVASQLNEAIAAGDWKLYTTFQERISRVTAEDVRRVAAAYCVERGQTVGYYVPETAGEEVQ